MNYSQECPDLFPRAGDCIIPETRPGQARDQAVIDQLAAIADNDDAPVVFEVATGPRLVVALHIWCPPQVRVPHLLPLLEWEDFNIPDSWYPRWVAHHHMTMYSLRGDQFFLPPHVTPFVYASSDRHRMARFMLRFPVPDDVKRHLETLRQKLMV